MKRNSILQEVIPFFTLMIHYLKFYYKTFFGIYTLTNPPFLFDIKKDARA